MVILIRIKSMKSDNTDNYLHCVITDFPYLILLILFSIKWILLSIVFVLGREMKHFNRNKKDNTIVTAAAKVFSLATILVVATGVGAACGVVVNWQGYILRSSSLWKNQLPYRIYICGFYLLPLLTRKRAALYRFDICHYYANIDVCQIITCTNIESNFWTFFILGGLGGIR